MTLVFPSRRLIASVILCFAASVSAADVVPLSSLDLTKVRQSWGRPQVDRSMREKPLSIAGKAYERGIGTRTNSTG